MSVFETNRCMVLYCVKRYQYFYLRRTDSMKFLSVPVFFYTKRKAFGHIFARGSGLLELGKGETEQKGCKSLL